MRVQVETADTAGDSLAKVSPSGTLYETAVYSGDDKKAERRIHEIIAANLGQTK